MKTVTPRQALISQLLPTITPWNTDETTKRLTRSFSCNFLCKSVCASVILALYSSSACSWMRFRSYSTNLILSSFLFCLKISILNSTHLPNMIRSNATEPTAARRFEFEVEWRKYDNVKLCHWYGCKRQALTEISTLPTTAIWLYDN